MAQKLENKRQPTEYERPPSTHYGAKTRLPHLCARAAWFETDFSGVNLTTLPRIMEPDMVSTESGAVAAISLPGIDEAGKATRSVAPSPCDSFIDAEDDVEFDGSGSNTSTSASRPYSPGRKTREERGPRKRRPRRKGSNASGGSLPSLGPALAHMASGLLLSEYILVV